MCKNIWLGIQCVRRRYVRERTLRESCHGHPKFRRRWTVTIAAVATTFLLRMSSGKGRDVSQGLHKPSARACFILSIFPMFRELERIGKKRFTFFVGRWEMAGGFTSRCVRRKRSMPFRFRRHLHGSKFCIFCRLSQCGSR